MGLSVRCPGPSARAAWGSRGAGDGWFLLPCPGGQGLAECGLRSQVPVVELPVDEGEVTAEDYWQAFTARAGTLTHLIAVERAGPNHTAASILAQTGSRANDRPRLWARSGRRRTGPLLQHKRTDITAHTSPAHLLFEAAARQAPRITTVGIGDGGNEIGMGRGSVGCHPAQHPPGRTSLACRVPTDYLIVCGVSNWGAYGLAAGVTLLRGHTLPRELLDPVREEELLRIMVEQGPLVDGVSGQPTLSVDGLDFRRYAQPLRTIAGLAR